MPPARALRAPADQGHEQGNQRRGDQQHQARDHIHRKQQHGKCHRQHGGGGHGRQVFGEEAIQRLDLVHHGAGQHARGLAPAPVRPLVHQALEQGQAHLALDPLGGDGAGAFAGPGDTGADQHQRGDASGCRPAGPSAAPAARWRHPARWPAARPGSPAARRPRAARHRPAAGAAAPIPPGASTIATARARACAARRRIMLQAAGAARRRRVPHAHASSRLRAGHANGLAQFEPHGVENGEGAGQPQPEYPREIPT